MAATSAVGSVQTGMQLLAETACPHMVLPGSRKMPGERPVLAMSSGSSPWAGTLPCHTSCLM
eukprot:13206025-Alexandrium_andersonii.AAC.1